MVGISALVSWAELDFGSGSRSGSMAVSTARPLARTCSPGVIGVSAGCATELTFGGGPWSFGLANILAGVVRGAAPSGKGGGGTHIKSCSVGLGDLITPSAPAFVHGSKG